MDNENIAGFLLKDWYAFDNFAPFQVEWRGKLYPTTEHAYQSAHFIENNPDLAEMIRNCRSPKQAQAFANENADKDDPGWKDKKLSIMEEIVRCKLNQHQYVHELLMSTGDKTIVEMNDNDEFWGWGKSHNAQNNLGKIWMKLRDELR